MKKQNWIVLVVLFSSLSSLADSKDEPTEKNPPAENQSIEETKGFTEKAGQLAQDTAKKISDTLNETRERRSQTDYFILGNYSLMDLLIPSKIGLSIGVVKSADVTWEIEYLKGSLSVPFVVEDLGKMEDEKISLIRRSYFGGNSFNFSYGLTYFDFSLHLGDKLLNRISGGNYPSLDLVRVQSAGFNLGIGNRWTFKKDITLGVDWISWSQPIFITKNNSSYLDYATNPEDRDRVDKAMKIISHFPRLAFLKFQFGVSF